MMGVLLLTLLLFSGGVIVVGLVKHLTVKEAVIFTASSLKRLCEKIWEWGNPPPDYPTHVGTDGVRIRPEIVDREMTPLLELFPAGYCNGIQVGLSCYTYCFSVHLPMEHANDAGEFEKLVQKQAEACLTRHLRQYGYYVPAEPLTAIQLRPDHLLVSYARNENGLPMIQQIKQQVRTDRYAEESSVPISAFTEAWEIPAASSEMIWGYRGEVYREHGIALPIKTGIGSHCHALITGSSGSGKSTALLFLLGKFVQAVPDAVVYVCDFKNSPEFRFLQGYSYYFAGEDCVAGIRSYYEAFHAARREEGESASRRHLLVCDEYPGLIQFLQLEDKRKKTKQAEEVMSRIAQILMLGRGTGAGFGCWLVTQYAQSNLFAGSRDNFMVRIGLGNLSKEQKGMLFSGEDLPDRVFLPGEGVLLADGQALAEVRYPLPEDADDWNRNLHSLLMRSGGACAASDA